MNNVEQAAEARRSVERAAIEEARRQRTLLALREGRWSWARLLAFVAALVLLWGLQPHVWAALAACGGGLLIFVWTVKAHAAARSELEHADLRLIVTAESQKRYGGAVTLIRGRTRPEDDALDAALPAVLQPGPIWPLTGQERDDLDFYSGPVGLFGLLNRASTALGARRLRDRLEQPLLDADRIRETQAAVRWLSTNSESRMRLLARLAAARGEDARLARLIRAIAEFSPLRAPGLAALRVWSLVTTVATVFAVGAGFSGEWQWNFVVIGIAVLNAALIGPHWLRLRALLAPWREVVWAARALSGVIHAAVEELPQDGLLGALAARLTPAAADNALPALARRAGWAETGGAVHAVFNLIAFHDLHVAHALQRIVVPAQAKLLAAIAAVGELEALISLACFSAEQPQTCYPELVGERSLRIVEGVHPLVPPPRAVGNDIALDSISRVLVVTGSNMAGKSTYLRMVGVNVLLAQLGCAACAREMKLSPIRLLSDLRANDNLAESESYFLSEVRHLRRMVTPPAGAAPVLGLIDEPFRGTNSLEQTAASVGVLRHLIGSGELFLVATHDRHLTSEVGGNAATNVHFRENLDEHGALVFDYRLRPGPATSRNALRVLEREGYPPGIVADANAWAQRNSEPS